MRHHVGVAAVRYTIGELAQKTGLSPHTIRAWERRYHAISPDRTESNQRAYSRDQLDRLVLLKRATDLGHPIGRVAGLADSDLVEVTGRAVSSADPDSSAHLVQSCLAAVEGLREEELTQILRRSLSLLGIRPLVDGVILPLLVQIGQRWQEGQLRIHQEHMATAVVRGFLADQLGAMNPPVDHPRIVVTTLPRQHHEIGALLAAVACAAAGWNVLYLGPNLPSREIADAALRSRADAVAVSIVYPLDDPELGSELAALRSAVGPTLPIFAGGSGAGAYGAALEAIGARRFENWSDLTSGLNANS